MQATIKITNATRLPNSCSEKSDKINIGVSNILKMVRKLGMFKRILYPPLL